jgi:hypothetical protein
MQSLASLIPTPRATKRFVNIYRLLRASVDDDERASFLESKAALYKAVLLMLAIQIGFPEEATNLIHRITLTNSTATLQSLFDLWDAPGSRSAELPFTNPSNRPNRYGRHTLL